MLDVYDIIDEAVDFMIDHWKPILVFAFLVLTGIAAILYQTINELEETEQQVKDESTRGIVETFADAGEQTSESISDPGAKATYKFLWILLGVLLVLIIVIMIGKAFEPIITTLNPVNIAKSFR
ncbi:hypothetical protein J4429_01225 [Candidatus Pacearchaeota archaeon]|nr:hypothetical protein [Candidatus Pacearchaeota archaeon]